MANETDTGLMGQRTTAEALIAEAAKPFDPAALLTAPPAPRRPLPEAEALHYRAGPTPEVVLTFDPAALLGDAARRGPAMIGDGKPLVARIGGVEVVTIPLEHYAALLSSLKLAPVEVASKPEEATIDLGEPQEHPIAIPPGPLDTRITPPEPEKSTTFSARRREKHEKRGGPMDAKGQPEEREPDVHDTLPRGRKDQLDLA